MLTQIPMRKSRKMRVGVDHSLYSLRNLVERCFNKLKNARRVATRYDKTAESVLGFIDRSFHHKSDPPDAGTEHLAGMISRVRATCPSHKI